MNRWRTDNPWGYILAAVSVLLVAAGSIQFIAQRLIGKLAGVALARLTPFEYVGLWGAVTPASRYGLPAWNMGHWAVVLILSTLLLAVVTVTIVLLRRRGRNPELLKGLAPVGDVIKHAGRKQLMRRAHSLRPLLSNPKPEDVGFLIATYRGTEVWVSIEDPIILVGPSRSGKGFYFIIEMIMRAPGAVVTTSCKVDNVKLTLGVREGTGGAALVFAPGVDSAAGLGHKLRWNPISGCEEHHTLDRRMEALIPKDTYGSGTTNGGHWDILGRQLATALFHAAALDGKTVDDVWGWVVNVARAHEAHDIISAHPKGLPEHAARLSSVLTADPEKRDTSWATLATVLSWMGSRSVREWLKPDAGHNFDIPEFLLTRGTLFMIGNEDGTGGYQQVVGALVQEIDYVAEGIAAAMPGSRLDPSVSFILDEAANFHLASLPKLISAGGGVGRQVVAVFQSRSQMSAWGPGNDRAMWDAAAVKIVLPGGADEQDLRGLSALVGETTEKRLSFSESDRGGTSSWSEQEKSILTGSAIRTMPKGTALIFHREMKPIVGRLSSWLQLKDAKTMQGAERELSTALQDQSQYAQLVRDHIARQSK
jgi:type IV secretory pathway TraG/TraD family ATPase VirD4